MQSDHSADAPWSVLTLESQSLAPAGSGSRQRGEWTAGQDQEFWCCPSSLGSIMTEVCDFDMTQSLLELGAWSMPPKPQDLRVGIEIGPSKEKLGCHCHRQENE